MAQNIELLEKFKSVCSTRDDGRLAVKCADALDFAKDNNIPATDVARICNKNNIKITGCQLGCFK